MDILLSRKRMAFPWFSLNGLHVRGQFVWRRCFYHTDNFDHFVAEAEPVIINSGFQKLVQELEGNFAIIYVDKDAAWAAVDVARSLPLFYSAEREMISDDAEKLRNALSISAPDVNTQHLAELLLTGYNMLEDTVYDEIRQLDLGQYVCIQKKKIYKKYYFTHIQNINIFSYKDFARTYPDVEKAVFGRLIEMADNRQIVVSLSGGFDSRYLAAMLKELDYKNVICYTFGNPKKYEMQFGKLIAESLGFQWYGIEYTDEAAKTAAKMSEDYLMLSHNHSTTPHISHFLSVKFLKENQLIEPDALFLTGFCGDLPAGSFVFDEWVEKQLKFDNAFLSRFFVENEYFNYGCSHDVLDQFAQKILKRTNELGTAIDFQSFVQIHDAIFTASRPSKMICNANRVFEYFGYEWLMPMWDKAFLEYWYSLSFHLRRGQAAYKRYLSEKLFRKYGIAMMPYSAHSLPWYFRKRQLKTVCKHRLGAVLLKASYTIGVPIRRKLDWDNNVVIAMSFYKRIAYKRMVNFKRANVNTVMHLWLCERLYGSDNLRKVRRFLKKDEK